MSHTSLPVTIPYLISDWTFFLRCQQNKGASETQWFKKHTILVAQGTQGHPESIFTTWREGQILLCQIFAHSSSILVSNFSITKNLTESPPGGSFKGPICYWR